MGKPKLLLLHGALGSMSEFDPLWFFGAAFETLPFNFTGHDGRRIQPEGFTMTSWPLSTQLDNSGKYF
ncbi:MAG: hypothetical protein U0T81_16325 [Saprospiraceae bacterium]